MVPWVECSMPARRSRVDDKKPGERERGAVQQGVGGAPDRRLITERLNQGCFCITLDRAALGHALEQQVDDTEFATAFVNTRPHLFSSSPVFLLQSDIEAMLRVVRAIEAVARLPGYR